MHGLRTLFRTIIIGRYRRLPRLRTTTPAGQTGSESLCAALANHSYVSYWPATLRHAGGWLVFQQLLRIHLTRPGLLRLSSQGTEGVQLLGKTRYELLTNLGDLSDF